MCDFAPPYYKVNDHFIVANAKTSFQYLTVPYDTNVYIPDIDRNGSSVEMSVVVSYWRTPTQWSKNGTNSTCDDFYRVFGDLAYMNIYPNNRFQIQAFKLLVFSSANSK